MSFSFWFSLRKIFLSCVTRHDRDKECHLLAEQEGRRLEAAEEQERVMAAPAAASVAGKQGAAAATTKRKTREKRKPGTCASCGSPLGERYPCKGPSRWHPPSCGNTADGKPEAVRLRRSLVITTWRGCNHIAMTLQ